MIMRRRRMLAGALVLAGVFSLGLGLSHTTGPLSLTLPWGRAAAGQPGEVLAPSNPTRVAIPAAAVEARVRPLGLDRTGAIAAPSMRRADQVGWYRDGPSPGQYGAAVLVGHVDDRAGPAVFHRIGQLRPGDRVEVSRRDGQVARFEVTRVGTYPKARLPAEEVYGGFDRPELRLITCGGRWLGGDTGYADNVVVFATLTQG